MATLCGPAGSCASFATRSAACARLAKPRCPAACSAGCTGPQQPVGSLAGRTRPHARPLPKPATLRLSPPCWPPGDAAQRRCSMPWSSGPAAQTPGGAACARRPCRPAPGTCRQHHGSAPVTASRGRRAGCCLPAVGPRSGPFSAQATQEGGSARGPHKQGMQWKE